MAPGAAVGREPLVHCPVHFANRRMDIDQRDEKTQIMYRIKREGKKKSTDPRYGL